MHEFSGSLSLSLRSIAHSSTAKAAPTASLIFLARFPEPATAYDRSGLTNFNPVELTSPNPVGKSGIYLLRTRRQHVPTSPISGVGLGGLVPLAASTVLSRLVPHTESTALGGIEPLAESTVLGGIVPRTEHAALGGLPLTSTAFHDFRTHESRIRIDGLAASRGRFVARVSAPFATTERCTGRGSVSPAAVTVFALGFAIPIDGGTGCADVLAAATPIAQPTPLSRSSTQETALAATTGPTVFVSALLGTSVPPSLTTSRQTATATPRCKLWTRARRDPSIIFQTTYKQAASPTAVAGSARRRDPFSCRFAGPHGATTVRSRPRRAYMGTPLLRLTPSTGVTPPAHARSDALSDAAELRFAGFVSR